MYINNKLLTISIAAYNVEQYLKKCLDSFIEPSIMSQLEVLIVNDGSKDSTPEIAREYEKKYPDTFKAIDKPNGGHGSTINTAIENATGKYFKVIDSDDWVITEELVKLVNKLGSTDADAVITHFDWVTYDESKCIKHFDMLQDGLQYDKVYSLSEISEKVLIKMHGTAFKTEILKQNKIKIDEHCFYVDQEFCMYPMLYCESIVYIDADIVQYRLGQSGQSMSKESMQRNVDQHLHVLNELIKYYDKAKASNASRSVLRYMERHISYMLGSQIKIYLSFKACKARKNDIKQLDKRIKKDYPQIYKDVQNKAVWMLRWSGYALYGAAVLALGVIWK